MARNNQTILLKIDTTTAVFSRRFKSASHFYRQLSNSKLGLSGGGLNNNRAFWKRHLLGGIYYFIPKEDGSLQIVFLIQMKNSEKLEGIKMSLRARIKRLLQSISVNIEIQHLDDEELERVKISLEPFNFHSQAFGETYKSNISIAN